MMVVEVAVVGAGAAGLVAARHLLRCGLHASIFESRSFVGGAWNAGRKAKSSVSPVMWETLTPNLSKYTSRFSDFCWPETTPTFPTLADMNQYLDQYADKYVVNHDKCTLNLGCTVTHVCNHNDRYKVEWERAGSSHSKDFDAVVVATGFFSTPVYLDGLRHLLVRDDQVLLHSSNYGWCNDDDFADQTVAVIGNSFSAHEIASDVVRRQAKRVVNILGNHVPYVLPRFVPSPDDGGFLPLDYVLYRRKEDAAKLPVEQIVMDQETCRQRHEFLGKLVGLRKQAQIQAKGFPVVDDLDSPPLVSISDDYLNLVIDGKIQVVRGRVMGASGQQAGARLNIELEDGTTIPGVDRIIACTGYRSRLHFLAPEILDTLQYDESDGFAPMILCYDAFHPKLPGLGFVGMYRGAYFGVMELQARLLAGLWSGTIDPLSKDDISQALQASNDIRQQTPRAQFPHWDYCGVMDALAQKLDLVPSDFGTAGTMVSPAFYQPDKEISVKCQDDLDQQVQNQRDNIPKAALSALVGKWSFERSINDKLSSSTQRVYGQVVYSLQNPRFETLRYREDGFLDLPNGNKLEVFREYEYLHKNGALEINFVENGEPTYLFLSLKFEKQDNGYWIASSDHLCIKDLYKGTFKIAFDGIGASEVSMTYRVKGPNKDYESVTHLRPIRDPLT